MNDITDNSQHTHKQFDTELEDLREKVLLMGGKVENQLSKAIQALTKADVELSDQLSRKIIRLIIWNLKSMKTFHLLLLVDNQ